MSNLVLVNERDEEISTGDAVECHRGSGRLHRAFTIFLFNSSNKLLIQKRSKQKLLWPLFWESSCSSHPLPGEGYLESGEKRLKQELGIGCKLALKAKFQYFAKYKDIGSENEVSALLIGEYDGKVRPSVEEVESWKRTDLEEIRLDTITNPTRYAPWLVCALKCYDGEE